MSIVLMAFLGTAILFQGQTFYGKRKSGYFETQEDGAPFGYYVPRQINAGQNLRYPLVVVFGQQTTNANQWRDILGKDDLIIVAIQPKMGGTWTLPTDIVRVLSKVDYMKKMYPIDPDRIWAVGYGASGNIALLLAINHPESFRAAATVDSKVVNTIVSGGDTGDGSFVGTFDFRNDSARHLPLLLIDFGEGSSVSKEDSKKTREVLEQYGYPVTYQSLKGYSEYPTKSVIHQMYDWLRNQGK